MLPKKIKAAYLSVNVEIYNPNPLICYHCQVFGHHQDNCMKNQYVEAVVETSIAVMIATVKEHHTTISLCSIYIPPRAKIEQKDLNEIVNQLPAPYLL